MDIKLKNSRKTGITVVVLLLAFCAAVMISWYGNFSANAEYTESSEDGYWQKLSEIGYDLARGNYILYNEYTLQTPLEEVLEKYGQQSFDLTKRYFDYELFDEEGKALLNHVNDQKQNYLSESDSEYYAFRIKYIFGTGGDLANVEVDGTEIGPEQAYDLEKRYIAEAINAQTDEISNVAVPDQVTVIYGMTLENLNAYSESEVPHISISGIANSASYGDSVQGLSVFIILAALLLPLFKKTDISELKIFCVPFEIPAAVLIFGPVILRYVPVCVIYLTVTDRMFPGMETAVMLINFLMWMLIYGILFWCITSVRAVLRMKGNYWKERTLTAEFVRKIKKRRENKTATVDGYLKRTANGAKKIFLKQYDELLHFDFRDKTNRMILKVVCINFGVVFVVCLFWYYGLAALIIYSAVLFVFLRKYTKDLQEKFQLLLTLTNEIAQGHLDTPIEGDTGIFDPISQELKQIQKGFKKAVDEEVKNERMKTELVTNVSHDLRTPLTAIITYTTLLKEENDEEKRREYIDVLERKSLRLKVLIEDLFEMSKAASGNITMNFVKVDIADLLKQVALENDERVSRACLELRWKLPEEKVFLWLDSQKTYRIFENLIVNITKYAMPHTRVYIEVEAKKDAVCISMKNISAEELNFDTEEITHRFVRGDISRNTEGSGLGLAIAKNFAELQNGRLKISTEADLFRADIIFQRVQLQHEDNDSGKSM